MKKITKQALSLILAMVLILSCVPTVALAAEQGSRTWYTITGGPNNGGGHNYGNGASSGPAFYQYNGQDMISGGTISLALKPSNNWGVFYSYIDDNNWLYVGYDNSSKWYYQYKWNGSESYPQISGLPDPVEGEELSLTISLSNETLSVTVNGTTVNTTNQTLKELAAAFTETHGDLGKFGVMTKGQTTISFADFEYAGESVMMDDSWGFCAERAGQTFEKEYTATAPVSGTVTNTANEPVEGATVRVGVNSTTTDANGQYSFEAIEVGEYAFAVTKAGYLAYSSTITVEDAENNVVDAVIESKAALDLSKYDTIESDDMIVYLGKEFPVVARYEMKSDETGKTFFRGNETELNEIVINGINIVPTTIKEPEVTDPTVPSEPSKPEVSECKKDETCVLAQFSDIDPDSCWYHDGVHYCVEKELMKGMSDTTFEPDTNTSRAMVVTILYRQAGSPSIDGLTEPFTDVADDAWYYEAIVWAYNNGVVNGTSATTFAPDANVTRQDVATILYRYLESPDGTGDLSVFPDVANVWDHAKEAMAWAVGEGLITGDAKDGIILLDPLGKATRAQIATILMRHLTAPAENASAAPAAYTLAAPAASTPAASKTYELHVEDAAASINLDMTVVVSVEANTLTWEVTELTKAEGCARIATIDIPHLNILSVDASEEESVFAGAKASTTTTSKADTYITFDDGFVPSNEDGYLYAFLTNGKLSAGLHSNSEKEGDKRVERINGADTMSLTSAVWYYESGDAATGQPYAKNYTYQVSELPCIKVAIANGDLNGDDQVDWNDGAIAFRDVMHTAQDYEVIKDIVNYRIVMNFESAAPNPFLVTADNVKKVYLATDGLPQALLLKGYGNEGHDSANSEYADVGERIGGIDDFQDLIKIAHDYNTEVGIHVNAQEIYPEAKSMNDVMITTVNGTINDGTWGWLDQSVEINKLWDLASDARLKRFVQLYDRINETDFLSLDWDEEEYVKDSQGILTNGDGVTEVSREALLDLVKADAAAREDNMDFIYLDVWYQDAWETRRIAEEINSLGWRFSTEFSEEGEYDSTWQHWSTDTVYGGAAKKGYNSDIIRFLRNDQRDSQVLNWPAFGGTADNPLLGGFRLYGFEGWGGQQNFNDYIEGTFNENLPTKFLQHYEVIKWENYAAGESPVGNTEKEITLANDDGDIVVVTRNEEQRSDIEIERTITLNGKVVLNTDTKESTYLLPWIDNDNGEEKLYHWNLDSGETTWELQDDWAALANVVVYKLTDQGRVDGQTVAVVNGELTLTAEAATAYVVVKGEQAKNLKNDFGEYDYVVDPGFNGYVDGAKLDSADWTGDIAAEGVAITVTNLGDQKLAMSNTAGDVAVTTTIRGLTVGKDYVAEVYVANESDAKAAITVNAGNKESTSYTYRSIVTNTVSCDSEHGTKMQRMLVTFVAEAETAALTLSREAGSGYTHFDDIRVVNQKLDNYKEDGSFVQDFESVVQGLYPFVLKYNAGGDSRTHLSQANGEYTSKGWFERVIDDVIDGEWSLKHHTRTTGVIYQTIPQNFRFEPGKVYQVEFDYQAGSAGYQMIVGDGTSYTPPTTYLAAASEDTHVTMQVIGSGSGQTWIGLYGQASLIAGDENGNPLPWGQSDFILDNLKITKLDSAEVVTVSTTELLLGETADIFGSSLDKITWTASEDGIVEVDQENNVIKAVGAGTVVLTATFESGKTEEEFTFTVKDTIVSDIARSEYPDITSSANTVQTSGEPAGSGIATAATDGDSSTYWHSAWSGFTVSPSNPAIITVELGKTLAIGGFKFQQRPGTNNGIVYAYSYKILDAAGNVLASGDNVSVPAADRVGGAWIVQELDESVNAATIEISVLEGQGNFAAISEIAPVSVRKITLS